MNLGGPVWHASAAHSPPRYITCRLEMTQLMLVAREAILDVGDEKLEWIEVSKRACHIRRRLTAAEQEKVGDVVDCRGTAEWTRRYHDMVYHLPEPAKRLAQMEMEK